MTDRALSMDHIALRVREPARSLAFYADTLGLPLIAVHDGADWDGMDWLMMIFMLADGRQIALCALDGPAPPAAEAASDLPHLAFSAPDETALAGWRVRLDKAGVPYKEEDHGGQRSIYLRDPDGLTLEITAPPSVSPPECEDARKAAQAWIERRR